MISERRFFLIAVILLLAIAFVHNGSTSLWDQDEAAYAGFAKNMLESGNWLVQDFMWSDIHRKPPLHIWSIAISYALFGVNEFSTRLPAAMSIVLTFWMLFQITQSLYNDKTARYSILILGTTFFIPVLAKVSLTDGMLLMFSTLCCWSVIEIIQGGTIKWTLWFWIGFAGALLTKGPPIFVFSGVFICLLVAFHPHRLKLVKLHPWFFLPLALSPILIWGWLSWQQDNGVFIKWMIDWYIFKRVGGSVLGQSAPAGTHFIWILLFFMPYLMLLPNVISSGWKLVRSKEFQGSETILWLWLIAAWMPFEFSPSKLPSYVVLAHLPFSVLMSKELVRIVESSTRLPNWNKWISFILMLLVGIAMGFSGIMLMEFNLVILVVALVFLIVPVWLMTLENEKYLRVLIPSNLLVMLVLMTFILPVINAYKSTSRQVADYAKDLAKDNATVIIGNAAGHPPSLPFYLGEEFQLIETWQGELQIRQLLEEHKSVVFVLNKAQSKVVEDFIPAIEFQTYEAAFTDRKETTTYFIGHVN